MSSVTNINTLGNAGFSLVSADSERANLLKALSSDVMS